MIKKYNNNLNDIIKRNKKMSNIYAITSILLLSIGTTIGLINLFYGLLLISIGVYYFITGLDYDRDYMINKTTKEIIDEALDKINKK